MTSPMWTRPHPTSYGGVRSTAYGDTTVTTLAATRYDRDPASYSRANYGHLSPTTSRRKIVELERRLAELHETSNTMRRQLGKAERSLRDLDINESGGHLDVDGRRRSHRHRRSGDVRFSADVDTDDSSWSDDQLMTSSMSHHHPHHRPLSQSATATGFSDRESLRQEIAQLREDLRILRRQCASCDDVTGYGHRSRDVTANIRDVDDYHRYPYHHQRSIGDYDGELSDWGRRQIPSGSVDDMHCLPSRNINATSSRSHYCSQCNLRSDGSPTCCSGTGLRSVLYKPTVTQHNKSSPLLSSTATTGSYRNLYDHTFDTNNKRSFKPYRPSDINIGDIVKFRRSGGSMELGRVYYIGHLPGKSEAYLGVELDSNTGSHDGLHNGFRYFQCKPNRGLFVPFDHVVMAWGSSY